MFNSIYSEYAFILNPNAVQNLQIRSSLQTHTSAGMTEAPLTMLLNGRPKDVSFGTIKAQDVSGETECTYTVQYIRLEIAGVKILEFDVLSGVYFVNGEDIATQYRRNLGI